MRASPCLEPFEGYDTASRYLVRLWVPGGSDRERWRTSDWWLDSVTTAEDAIRWARERSGGSPAEVFLPDTSGALLRIWGEEPDDASTTVTIYLAGE